MELIVNERALKSGNIDYAKYLLDLGDGKIEYQNHIGEFKIKIENVLRVDSFKELYEFVYKGLKENYL